MSSVTFKIYFQMSSSFQITCPHNEIQNCHFICMLSNVPIVSKYINTLWYTFCNEKNIETKLWHCVMLRLIILVQPTLAWDNRWMGKCGNHNKKSYAQSTDLDLVQVKGAGRSIQVCCSPYAFSWCSSYKTLALFQSHFKYTCTVTQQTSWNVSRYLSM
jgi:hypothetical protein